MQNTTFLFLVTTLAQKHPQNTSPDESTAVNIFITYNPITVMENNTHNAKKSEEKFSVCPLWNWFSALGCAGVLNQAQVKHILVKLCKRLSCLSGKLSPSVILLHTVSILWCLVHTLSPPSLSLSRSLSLVLLPPPSPFLQYVCSQPTRVELARPVC